MRRYFNAILFLLFFLNIIDAYLTVNAIENVSEVSEVNRFILYLYPFGANVIWYVKIAVVSSVIIVFKTIHDVCIDDYPYISGVFYGATLSITGLYGLIVLNNILLLSLV